MIRAKITKKIIAAFLALASCAALICAGISLSDQKKARFAQEEALVRSYGSTGTLIPEANVEGGGAASEKQASASAANLAPSAGIFSRQSDYCESGLAMRFSWVYSDPENDPQAYYQIQIDDNNDFSSPSADSGKVASATDSYAAVATKLAYGTAYRWRLKVWDDKGNDSGWISGQNFSTPLHGYPDVGYILIPAKPKAEEEAVYTDSSQTFGGSSVAARLWAFDGAVPAGGTSAVMTVKYAAKGAYTAKLTVTDSSGYACTKNFGVTVRNGAPDWDEQ